MWKNSTQGVLELSAIKFESYSQSNTQKNEAVAKFNEFCDSLLGLQKNSAERTKRRAQPLARRRTVVRRGVRFVRSIKRTQCGNFHYYENFHIEYNQINHKKWLIHFVLFALCDLCILLQPHFFVNIDLRIANLAGSTSFCECFI